LWVDGEPTERAYHTHGRAFLFARSAIEPFAMHNARPGLPRLAPGEGFKGPSYSIPYELRDYFTRVFRRENEGQWRFDYHKLKLVQKVRFLELCRKYGREGEYPDPDRGRGRKGHWKHPDPVRLLP
jgi:hypothetical protein